MEWPINLKMRYMKMMSENKILALVLILVSCWMAVRSQPSLNLHGEKEPIAAERALLSQQRVTKEEMIAAYDACHKENWWTKPIDGDGIPGIRLFAAPLLADCPEAAEKSLVAEVRGEVSLTPKEKSNTARYFALAGLHSSQDGTSDKKTFEALAKKYGITPPNSRMDYPGGDVIMLWLSGDYLSLETPTRYYSFIVSAIRQVVHFDKGEVHWGPSEYSRSVYERYATESISAISVDGHWGKDTETAMRLLSHDTRRFTSVDTTLKSMAAFTLLFTIGDNGRMELTSLDPRQPSPQEAVWLAELQRGLDTLPPWSLSYLYTSDGRILPGRYISAMRGKDRWVLMDRLQASLPYFQKGR